MALAQLCRLQRRSPAGLSADGLGRGHRLGTDNGQGPLSPVGAALEGNFRHWADNLAGSEKYFQKSEKNVCIFGKMGYNKLE
jgi:hypothetical protein